MKTLNETTSLTCIRDALNAVGLVVAIFTQLRLDNFNDLGEIDNPSAEHQGDQVEGPAPMIPIRNAG